jgi:hypothetical protein
MDKYTNDYLERVHNFVPVWNIHYNVLATSYYNDHISADIDNHYNPDIDDDPWWWAV